MSIEWRRPTGVDCILIWLLLWPASVLADWKAEVDALLARGQPPDGVVFEIVSGDPAFLSTAVPAVRRAAERLRLQFPAVSLAVVSHGVEQFALARDKRQDYPEVHAAVEAMSGSEDIAVHVCGTHAGWRGMTAEEFPAYVDVAAVGPAQINDYLALGYVLVRVDEAGR